MFFKIFLFRNIKKLANTILNPFGFAIDRKKYFQDYYLYEYSSYEEYRKTQIFYNKLKIKGIWADKITLNRVANIVLNKLKEVSLIKGICHGTRNGFEQNYLRDISKKFDVIGTDISDTASDYENSIQWDFHDQKKEWHGTNQFIYTNSLDQSWKPKKAILTWLSQLDDDGLLIIEHTKHHGPEAAGVSDPFGVYPLVMPYVLTMWFGSQISITHSVAKKGNFDMDAWLFVISKNVKNVVELNNN